jgi:putative ABC transport system permease protein
MNMGLVAVRNLGRNKLRTLLTMAGVAMAIFTFILLRTILSAWNVAAENAAKDRVATRHKVSIIMTLPRRYVQEISEIPGVQRAASANWFGAKYPKKPDEFFGNFAVDPKEYLAVYDEIAVPEEQQLSWFSNRKGAVVGDALAKKFDWKVGDRVTLSGTIFPGDWEFEISGIYTATRKSIDRSSFMFHYDYLNDSPISEQMGTRDMVGWIVSRIDDPSRSAEISKAIDARFDERDTQTLSMSERAMNASFIGMLSAVLKAVDFVSVVILFIMALILGNTVAMGVRERTHEYGVLRAIGFLPKHLVMFVLGEAVTVGIGGGLLGLLIAYPLVNLAIGRWLEENMGGWFPFFRIAPETMVLALLLAAGLGLVAAAQPARAASRLKVVDALRRVG